MSVKPSKTSIHRFFVQALKLADLANKNPDKSLEQLVQENNEAYNQSRRKFLQQTGTIAAGVGLLGFTSLQSSCKKEDAKLNVSREIAIIGGGLAGLTAAWNLRKAGWYSNIYEGSSRIGGRIYTVKDVIAPGLTTELGGDFIDSGHSVFLGLATELGLSLTDLRSADDLALTEHIYYFNDRHYTTTEIVNALQTVSVQILNTVNTINNDPAQKVIYDNMSLATYLDSIGATGLIRSLIDIAYTTEFGLEISEQSSLNLLSLIDTFSISGEFLIFGQSDERYRIKGGNQKVTDALASQMSAQIQTDYKLTKISRNQSKYRLYFNRNGSIITKDAEFLVITVPFSALKDVDLSESGLSAAKQHVINTYGYGTNHMVAMGFSRRIWRTQGNLGYFFTDNGAQNGWDHSQGQAGVPGGLYYYTGGRTGLNASLTTAEGNAQVVLPKFDEIFPGIANLYNNRAISMNWNGSPFYRGSYPCYRPGQAVSYAADSFAAENNIHFAGDHCSTDYQGYMEGAAESAVRAAQNIIRSLS